MPPTQLNSNTITRHGARYGRHLLVMTTLFLCGSFAVPVTLSAQTFFEQPPVDGPLRPIFDEATPPASSVLSRWLDDSPSSAAATNADSGVAGSWLNSDEPQSHRIDLVATVRKLAISTAMVLMACFGILLVVKKLGLQPGGRTAATGAANITKSIKLGPRSFLHLVSIGGAKLVVGVDSTGIKKVIQISSAFEADLENMTQKEIDQLGRQLAENSPAPTNDLKSTSRVANLNLPRPVDWILGLKPQFEQRVAR